VSRRLSHERPPLWPEALWPSPLLPIWKLAPVAGAEVMIRIPVAPSRAPLRKATFSRSRIGPVLVPEDVHRHVLL